MQMPSEKTRKYIYRVLAFAVAPILILHGLVTETEASVYISAVATALGVGMAERNTDRNV